MLHPSIERKFGLSQHIYVFEVELALLAREAIPHFEPLSRYPAIRRDVAILIDENISADQIRQCISGQEIEGLVEIQIFDVYTGKGVPSGQKSIALGLILQDFSRTLRDTEVDGSVTRIMSGLNRELGASLRE